MTLSIVVLLVVVFVLLLWLGVFYVLSAIALSRIAKNRRIENPWMAWVPVANSWLLGSIADHYDRVKNREDRGFRKILMGWTIAQAVFSSVISVVQIFTQSNVVLIMAAIIQMAIIIIHSVFMYMAYYRIYQSCAPRHSVWMLVLSILSSIANVVILLCICNQTEGIEEYLAAESSAEGEEK